MEFKRVFVAGAGLMGSGIAQVCAQAGMEVIIYDVKPAATARAMEQMRWSLGKLANKGLISEAPEVVLGRVKPAEALEQAAGAQVVIEAIVEELEAKKRLFELLGQILEPQTIVGTNTSALPISELARAITHPERFVGLHFFSPVPMMKAVEVIKALGTSPQTFETARQFVLALGKYPVMVRREVPGFVVNRINLPSTVEAIRLVEMGVAGVEEIDTALKLATGRRMGVFETGDMVGLDVTHAALSALYRETGDARWFPPQLLTQKVRAGQLGRKSGIGWYKYDEQGRRLGPADHE